MQLIKSNKGDEKRIIKVDLQHDQKSKFEHMGFLSGEMIKVISKTNGIYVLEVKGSRIAIDELTAAKISVY